jgi:two-component system OmpR family sensor kinase
VLAIVAVVAVVVFGRSRRDSPPFPTSIARFVAETVARSRHDPRALRAELDRTRRDTGFELTIYDDGGRLLGSTTATPPPPVPPADLDARAGAPRPLPGSGTGLFRRLIRPAPGPTRDNVIRLSPAGDHAILKNERPRPPGPGFDVTLVLLSLGVASLILATMITRPLQRISEAAQRFGRGDLTARAGLHRQDEFGALSRAFDEMATRLTQLLAGQRELVASVSHELRTPLSRIRVALDLANEGDAEAARESLRDIAEDLAELEELVNDVLAMARLDAAANGQPGIPRLRTQRVDGHALVKKAAARFRAAHPDRALQVVPVDGPPSGIMLDADPNLLRRVLENLLENSHKYSGPDTPIELQLRIEGPAAVFSVVDLGQGIAAGDLPHVFEPFFRADRSRTRGTGGVGLGLALSKRVVEAHGGQIQIRSEPDRGTTVSFSVPLAADPDDPDDPTGARNIS